MEKNSIENRIIELKKQLISIVDKIEVERHESKDDEQSVLDELLGQKQILESELQDLESSLCDIKVSKSKPIEYTLRKDRKKIKVIIVNDSMIDSSKGLISKNSPLAKALEKARVGELLKIPTPLGDSEYLLLAKSK
jgi:transcription elongation GreA/GreB family factor